MTGWLIVASLVCTPSWVCAQALPEAGNMVDVAKDAGGRLILIEVARKNCPYCLALMTDYLEPMIKSGDYRTRVVMYQLHRDSEAPLVDFGGRKIARAQFADRYGATVTPTVLLLDAQGRLLASPLVGYSTPDFYGAYLDEAIDKAWARLKGAGRNP